MTTSTGDHERRDEASSQRTRPVTGWWSSLRSRAATGPIGSAGAVGPVGSGAHGPTERTEFVPVAPGSLGAVHDAGPAAATQPVGQRPAGPSLPDEIGPYRLLETLGEGGMGVVRLGVDASGRAVAVKVLRDHVAQDPSARARLRREFDTLARVRHRLVAPVLDVDTEGPRPYLVTRYVPGPPLDEWVRTHGPLTGDDLGRVGRGLAEALAAIHSVGVVHRDLKPGNVLMLGGEPIVIDFGIAHLADDARLTSTGLVMGTPGYLSPELLDGHAAGEATDWWGWAATLAFAATGRPPFGRGPMDAVFHRVYRGDVDLDGVDVRLRALLRAAIDPDPARRPDRSHVIAALDAHAAGREATTAWGSGTNAPVPTAGRTEAVGARPAIPREDPRTARIPDVMAATRVQPAVRLPASQPGAESEERAPSADAAEQRGWVPRQFGHGGAGAGSRAAGWGGGDPLAAQRGPNARSSEGSPGAPVPYVGIGRQGAVGASRAGAWPGGPGASPPGGAMLPHADPLPAPPRPSGLALAAGALVFVALAASWPTVAVCLGVLWCALARTVDSSVRSVLWRRQSRGVAGPGDIVRAVVLSPLRLVSATVTTALLALLAAPVVVGALFAAPLFIEMTQGVSSSPVNEAPLAVGGFAALVLAWWGPGGRAVRHGSRVMVRSITPGRSAVVVFALGLALFALFLALRTQASGVSPDWVPLTDPESWPLPWTW